MTKVDSLGFEQHFASLDDPRVGPMHRLLDMVAIALCAVLCGADDWVAVAEFGALRADWFGQFLALPHGTPSHDTFARVFAQLDARQFEQSFLSWVQALSDTFSGEIIAIDGKTLRRSHDRYLGRKAIHMVSAWASEQHLVLGQVQVDEKSNEITAIPELLRLLDLSDCIITIDAMGCQRAIAKEIVAKGSDYVLALKANQNQMYERAQTLVAHAQTPAGLRQVPQQRHMVWDKGHGRIEQRICIGLDLSHWLFFFDPKGEWSHLRTLIHVERRCQQDGAVAVDTRLYISSLPCNAPLLQRAVRWHWGVENCLHWVLDVAFREDDCRIRKGHGAHNFSILRRLALNLLRQDKTTRLGIKNKRLRAAWDPSYLISLLRPE